MRSLYQWIGLAGVAIALTGCVSQDKYQALKLDRDQLAERVAQSDSDARAAKAEADLLKKQLEAIAGADKTGQGLLANLTQANADLTARLDELNKKYMDALQHGGSGPLPEQLSNALAEFARANPDLVDFDSARGIVKFKSDVTFATGDATLTSRAKEVIAKFATILNSPQASSYELIVAGHTDNTPVVSSATITKGHKDNWFLSAHRAISVGEALQSDRVSSQRLGVTGYADQRPIASNASEAGKAQNRRVEVLILPTTIRGSAVMASETTAPRTSSKKAAPLNKDSVEAPMKPVFNK